MLPSHAIHNSGLDVHYMVEIDTFIFCNVCYILPIIFASTNVVIVEILILFNLQPFL